MRPFSIASHFASASLMALCAAASASPAWADPAETVGCAALCWAEVTAFASSPIYPQGQTWAISEGTVRITLTNTGPVSPPMPITLQMDGESPNFQVQVRNAQGAVVARSSGFFATAAGSRTPMDPVHVLMPGQSLTFNQTITGVPQDIGRVELVRDGAVVATLNTRFEDYRRNEQQVFKNGHLAAMLDNVPLPPGADRFVGAWDTPTRSRITLRAEGAVLRGSMQLKSGAHRGLVAHAGFSNDELVGRVLDADGREIDHLRLDLLATGQLRARRTADSKPMPTDLAAEDLEWIANRYVHTPPRTPQPQPPAPQPIPPVSQPTPPANPQPPASEPTPPVTQPSPPVTPQPTPPTPQPPTPQPQPPAPQPQPPTPQPQPPTPQPQPPAGGGSVPGQGGFSGVSPTWDIQFDGARVERDSEIHVFVSAKNRSTSDQYVTPGSFIPNLGNQDGEVITSRAVYRASGDAPTEFRPTVPVNEAVRIRFIFRPQVGSAQPRVFTLEQFGHRKLSFDVSSLRVGSLAQ